LNAAGTSCSGYDDEGNLISSKAPGESEATTNTYDPSGELLTASNAIGAITSSYDEAGRLVDSTDTKGAEEGLSYDADGNVITRAAAKGALDSYANYTTTYTYNAADQQTGETDPAGNDYSFSYDNEGRLKTTQYPNDSFSWNDYDNAGDLTAVYNRHGTLSDPLPGSVPADEDASPIADFAYSYDIDGRKIEQTRSGGTLESPDSKIYEYDNLGRLTYAGPSNHECDGCSYSYDLDSNRIAGPTCDSTYTYDPETTAGIDELTSRNTGGCDSQLQRISPTKSKAKAKPSNHPSSSKRKRSKRNPSRASQVKTALSLTGTIDYSYDDDGNVTAEDNGTETDTYSWDGRGRLQRTRVSGESVCYTYDPAGNLASRSYQAASSNCDYPDGTTNYLLGDLFETDGDATITTSYADGPAGDLASFDGPPTSGSTVTFLYYDSHGNQVAEADDDGTLTSEQVYEDFGAPENVYGEDETVHAYTGRWNEQYDTANDLILMGARPYDPDTGRFLAVDPVDGGSLNNYDYVGQDPINGFDLDGSKKCNIIQYVFVTAFCALKGIWGAASNAPVLPTVAITYNSKGEPTSGRYTILESRQELHKNGTPGKSQFGDPSLADALVLSAAAYADAHHLWRNNRVTLTLAVDIGLSGGHPTNRLTISRRNNGYVHGWPS